MSRPLVWVALGFVAGSLLAAHGGCRGVLEPLLIVAFGLAFPVLLPRLILPKPIGLFLCFAGASALLWNARHDGPPGDPLSRRLAQESLKQCSIEGRVVSADLSLPGADRAGFVVDVERVWLADESFDTAGKVSVWWRNPTRAVFPGESVRVQGAWTLALGRVNPGVEGVEANMRRRGVHTCLRVFGGDGVEILGRAQWYSVSYWAARLRSAQAECMARAVPESALPFIAAVWLGDRGGVAQDEYMSYVASGTAHILAISGVHVGIVFVAASALFQRLCGRGRFSAALIVIAVFTFALVGGARVSSMRAATMCAIYVLADLVGRERDAPTALGIAAIMFIAWRPDILLDCGFQLSFLSVASILLFGDVFEARLGRLPYIIRKATAMTLAVQVLPLPVAIHHFHVLPLMAPLANLLVVPLLAGGLWLGFLTGSTGFVWIGLARIFGHALLPVVGSIRVVARAVTALDLAHPAIVSPTPAAIACYWGAIGALVLAIQDRKARLKLGLIAAALSVLMIACWRPEPGAGEVVFLDVGHGDSVFARSPEGATLLVDAGEANRYSNMGERAVAPFLLANGVTALDYVLVTHADSDHMGGAIHIVERFDVGELILGPVDSGRPLEQRLMELCAARGVPVRRVKAGDLLPMKGARLEVLHPTAEYAARGTVNDASVVARLEWGGASVLLTGDIEEGGEAELARRGDCSATVIKVPHHGSDTSSTMGLIEATAPRHCVISTGGTSGRESLDAAVLARYEHRGIEAWRTDTLGAIHVMMAGGEVIIEGERQRRGYVVARTRSD